MIPFKLIQSNEIEKWRHDTFRTKEPETLKWIKSFKGGVFYDVGANIGIYSLYCASLFPNMPIFAFEPHANNYVHLKSNTLLNNYFNIYPIHTALWEKEGIETFCINDEQAGSSGSRLSWENKEFNAVTQKKIYTCTLDIASELFDFPTYIKIDVDGHEYNILKGAKKTLENPNLKSILIEINDKKDEICDIFTQNGFKKDDKFNNLANHSRNRRKKEGIKAENIIFTRES